jgi:hypothetical protein
MHHTALRPIFVLASLVFTASSVVAAEVSSSSITADSPPMIPVGDDAYLMWDRLPYQRIGVRAYMRCTYDRTGYNRDADASHFLYQEADDFNVTLDESGPGALYFVRTNHHHGSPWHYEMDGKDLIVKESATENPVRANERMTHSVFMPESLFPHPLTWTWPTTKGADLMWRPILFERSLRIAYSRTFYGTGYYIFHRMAAGTQQLSRPLASFANTPPDQRVLDLLSSAGTDIAPQGPDVATAKDVVKLKPFEPLELSCPGGSPATIRAIKFQVPLKEAYRIGRCRLRITWDNRWHPSVDVPIDLFFGAGRLQNDDGREYLVRGLPMVVRYDRDNVFLECYWPMPFFKAARIELENRGSGSLDKIAYEIRTVGYRDPVNHVGYFHATLSDHPRPAPGKDTVFLDTDQIEGGGPWSGNFVGMSWIFSHQGNLGTLEGDPRFFFDGSRTPQAMGTGTEEWGGGGDYWGGRNMTIPLAGHPIGQQHGKHKSPRDLINSAYRFLVADLFPFCNRAVIGLEHGAENLSHEHYSGVVYWYGAPAATLVLTDEINVCNEASSKAHDYNSPTATEPYKLISRYEWGPDSNAPGGAQLPGTQQFFPAEEDLVRVMRGTSEFTVTLEPTNLGVMLRRKFDYQYANQRAKVSVKNAETDDPWQYVGEWYTAGSNTCVHSRPQGENFSEAELAATQHNVITSNRRWREEEFLIPSHLSKGVKRLAIRVEYVPDERPLYPGHPYSVANAWSESRYWVYCYRLPDGNEILAED